MASVVIVFRKDKKSAKGKVPIHLRIIKHRKISYISTGISIEEKYWDDKNNRIKSSYPKSERHNNYILNKYNELDNQVLLEETTANSLSPRQLKEKIFGKRPKEFFEFAEKWIEGYEKIGTYDRNKSILKKFKDYTGGPIFSIRLLLLTLMIMKGISRES